MKLNREKLSISHCQVLAGSRPEAGFRVLMRKIIPTIIIGIGLLSFSRLPAQAQTRFDFSGMVKLFLSVYGSDRYYWAFNSLHGKGDFATKRLESRFTLKASISENVSARVRLDAFASPDALFGLRDFPEAGELASSGKAEPFELSLFEAYVKVNHFLLKNLDLTVGKQRIQWGTADKLNVVDNLNPVDLANFLTFDPDYYLERRPQTAFNLEYYPFKDSKLQLVWLVNRQYSPLPAGFSEMLARNLGPIPDPQITVYHEGSSLKKTNFGARFSTVLQNVDLGVSYYSGNYSLPYVDYVAFSYPGTGSTAVHFSYPGKKVIGLDLSSEFKSIGWWAEAALVLPEEVTAMYYSFIYANGEYLPVYLNFPLMEKKYWQWVVGLDYTFSLFNGLYLNVQYLRGLFDEAKFSQQARNYFGLRQGMWFGDLGHYLAGRAELRLLRGDLKLSLNSVFNFRSGDEAKSSAIFYPAVEYKVKDVLSFQAGAILALGDEEQSKFGCFRSDQVYYLSTKVSF